MTQTSSSQEVTTAGVARYEAVIGLEVHCQLLTDSKIFTEDVNQFGAEPNSNIGLLTLALPGTLPKLNKKVVEYAIKMGLACDCAITPYTIFDRKNYFYPDLPKGYQISQDKAPICVGGTVGISVKGPGNTPIERSIRLHHIHLEEDAGKSVHDGSDTDTLLDYNRAGTPLVEIVSEPDLRSAEETGAYVNEIRRLVRYLGISDGNMEEGSLRCDVNISLRPQGQEEYGTKVEIKNMNSIRNIMKAIEFEIIRQTEVLDSGGIIIQETRMFDVDAGKTYGMRVKETMNDYRYFPDPDLCPVEISDKWLNEIKAAMPALPHALREKFVSVYGIPTYDAWVLTDTREIASYFEEICSFTNHYKAASNWMMGSVKSYLNEKGEEIEHFPVSAAKIAELIKLVDGGLISSSVATQKVFPALLMTPDASPEEIAKTNNWIQNSNSNELETLIDEVLNSMADKVEAYRKGKKGLMGLFVGEVMKKSGGSADPKLVNQLLAKKL